MRMVSLGKVAEFINGRAFRPDEWEAQGLPIIRIQNLTGSSQITNFYSGEFDKKHLVTKGDILISWSASLGVYLWTGNDAILNQHIFKVVLKETVDKQYFYYAASNALNKMILQVHGSTMQHITKEPFEATLIPFPPLHEQKRIAAILEKADRLRRQRRYSLELSNTYLQSIFLEMFGNPVTNPKGEKIESLGNLLSIPPHIGTITPAREVGDQLCVRVGEVGEWQINLDQCKYVSLKGDELRRFSLLHSDIVLARAIGSESHLGKLSIMEKSSIPVVFDSHLMRLRPDNSRLLTPFLAYWLKSDGGRARFMQQARRTAVQFNINTEQISSIEIPLPPLPLQQKFSQIVQKFERLRAQQREAERQAEHLFQTLLHQAFQGNLDLRSGITQGISVEHSVQSSVVDNQLTGPFVQLRMNY